MNNVRAGRLHVLTLDAGTSSLRAQVWGVDGRPLPEIGARAHYRLETDPEGGAWLEPEEVLSAVSEALDETVARAESRDARIAAVALDTLSPTLLGVDEQGRPLTPIYTYADTRSRQAAADLRQRLDPAEVHERTGCPIHSSYLPSRLLWLERSRPRLFSRVARWMTLGEFLYSRFFRTCGVSYSAASWSGLLNRHRLDWDESWISLLPIRRTQLSPLRDCTEPFTGLRDPWARRWPALARVPWFPAVGDGAAANVGSGCIRSDRVALTIGSTGAIRAVLDRPASPLPAGLWSYLVNAGRPLLGGATTEGGSVFSWLTSRLQVDFEPDRLEAELQAMEPAAHGLVFLPFLAGERSPGWRDEARGSLVGLTLSTRPVEIVRAALESIAYRLCLVYRLMEPHLSRQHEIIGGGAGLLSSPAWLQILADVLGRRVIACAEPEVTGRGTALLALESLGLVSDLAAVPPIMDKSYDPDPARHRRHLEAMERHLELYQRLVGVPWA